MKRFIWLAMVSFLWAGEASAQIVIDGTVDAAYGSALSTQDTRTGYGDGPTMRNPDPVLTGNNLGDNGGSEIDQVFATVADGRLYVTVTGNLEGNFNKLHVFIDSVAGGVNQIDGTALPGGFDGFCCGGFTGDRGSNADNSGAFQGMSGLKFDNTTDDPSNSATFAADYALIFTHGGESVGPTHGDYNDNGSFDAADYTVWRDNLGDPITELPNRATETGVVDQAAYDVWNNNFGRRGRSEFWAFSAHFADMTQGTAGAVGTLGIQLAPRGEPKVLRPSEADALGDFAYKPSGNPGNTDSLLSSYTLDGLDQGELIDRNYALGAGGCADDGGNGCLAREFEFALDVDPNEVGTAFPNNSNHRNMNNFVDLQMALDNSNIGGVTGSGTDFALGAEDHPEEVMTGIELSIPLSAIGNPGSGASIRLMAFVGNGSFGYMSNQVSGDGIYDLDAGTGVNIDTNFYGMSPMGSFNDIPGEQFVTVTVPGAAALSAVPEPCASALAAVALLAAGLSLGRRRS